MEQPLQLPPREFLPAHIGIIMDGNGRWAQKRGLPRTAGHKAGAETFRKIAACCRDMGIPYLTVYAFSTENWKRPKDEVDAIMDLLRSYLDDAAQHREEDVRTCFIGDRGGLAPDLQEKIRLLEEESRANRAITVNIALNYGGRDELVHAARLLARRAAEGGLDPDSITEETVASALYTAGQPDPDLIIRPSGEKRLSNFLTWQSAYSEFVFIDVLWPDFSQEHLCTALWEYARRDRRFGGI